MNYPDQHRKPSWIDDDNWTSQKTDEEFDFLLDMMDYRPLTEQERAWIDTLVTPAP